ncbi:MAG TPA: hypothetical protein DCY97_00005 [Marinilabiliales bacterium]|nr:hypothetical protein [Marinilabiliales bacterium]
MKKLQASTLTEVIVALVIISLVTSMFFAIIIKVGNYHRNRKLILINQKILECIQEAKQQGFLEDETLEYEGYFLQKRVKPFKNIAGVFEIEVEAFSLTNKRLGSH